MRFKFLLTEILTGLRRNITMTVAMIVTTAIAIGLFGGGLLTVRLADQSRELYLDRLASQVFLMPDVSTNDPECKADPCMSLQEQLNDFKDVESVEYVSQDDAYEEAIRLIPQLKDNATKEAFFASFVVKLENPDDAAALQQTFEGQEGVFYVENQRDLIDRLFAVLDGLSNAAFAVAVVQAIGAILLIANMIQVSAFTRRTEVGIMRLVGASRWYTQLPFLLEAMVAALAGALIAIGGLIAAQTLFLDKALNQFYDPNPGDPTSRPLIAKLNYLDVLYISPILIFVSVAMAGVTAYVTLRLYVRR